MTVARARGAQAMRKKQLIVWRGIIPVAEDRHSRMTLMRVRCQYIACHCVVAKSTDS
jgi:hypothetical protein